MIKHKSIFVTMDRDSPCNESFIFHIGNEKTKFYLTQGEDTFAGYCFYELYSPGKERLHDLSVKFTAPKDRISGEWSSKILPTMLSQAVPRQSGAFCLDLLFDFVLLDFPHFVLVELSPDNIFRKFEIREKIICPHNFYMNAMEAIDNWNESFDYQFTDKFNMDDKNLLEHFGLSIRETNDKGTCVLIPHSVYNL